jgi:hypothetical protein
VSVVKRAVKSVVISPRRAPLSSAACTLAQPVCSVFVCVCVEERERGREKGDRERKGNERARERERKREREREREREERAGPRRNMCEPTLSAAHM